MKLFLLPDLSNQRTQSEVSFINSLIWIRSKKNNHSWWITAVHLQHTYNKVGLHYKANLIQTLILLGAKE